MIPRLRWCVCIVALGNLAAAVSLAQQHPGGRVDTLMKNGLKLAGSVEMDRPVYLAGETMNFTVAISNPSAAPLEVLTPFDYGTGWFVPLSQTFRHGREKWVSGGADVQRSIPENAPSVVLQPGDSLTHQYHFFDDIPGGMHLFIPLTAGSSPGVYRLLYAYGNWPVAEYQVVAPVVEEFIVVQLPKVKGESERADAYAFSLASGGQHFLCVRRQPSSHYYDSRADLRLAPDSMLTESKAHALSPYSRFAQSDTPFASLAATADAGANLTITWISQDKQSTLTLKKEDWLVEMPNLPDDDDSD
jgi:hypothetical protein